MNRKGSARDAVLIGVLIFSLAIAFFVTHYMLTVTVDTMLNVTVINASNASVSALQGIDKVTARFDYSIFAVFMGLVLALIITGWFIAAQPIFMFVYMIVIVIGVILSTVMANVWESVSTASIFGTTLNSFPITNNIMLNLPYYMAVIGFIGIVVMFAKPYLESRF